MQKTVNELSQIFGQAQSLFKRGNFHEAKQNFLVLLECDYKSELVLFSLSELSLHLDNFNQAASYLEKLILLVPNKITYYDRLANVYGVQEEWAKACECYQAFLNKNKPIAHIYYNLAFNQKKNRQYVDALQNYQLAIDNDISRKEEIYLNQAVIYAENLRKENDAIACLELAIKEKHNYVDAIYNLANLYEETGDKKKSVQLFSKILELEPNNYQVLARLADSKSINDIEDALIVKMKTALTNTQLEQDVKIDLLYALGKAYTDCKQYEMSFDYYMQANKLNRLEMASYNKVAQELFTQSNVETFTKTWFDKQLPISNASPIFLCGMFRSGSTLLEQILSSHPKVTAAGEIDYFYNINKQFKHSLTQSLEELKKVDLDKIAESYINDLNSKFPDSELITDKRPDNFLYIAIIKRIFPKSIIIHTVRNPLDNCLSVYFNRLSKELNYATNLEDIAHYYKEQQKLMDHWKKVFPETVLTVNYDELVRAPEFVIKPILQELDLEWHDVCLEFQHLKNRVKTASIWQVRKPLYKESSGRWNLYKDKLGSLITEFNN
jgi:tetratricopeptide (TPR) repeat protein